MDDQRRLLLFFAAALAIFVGWQMVVSRLYPPVEELPAVETPLPAPEAAPGPGGEAAPPAPGDEAAATEEPAGEPLAAERESRVTIDGPGFRAVFTNRGARLLSFRLADFHNEDGQPLELVRRRDSGPRLFSLVGPDLAPLPLDEALFAVEREESPGGGTVVRFAYRGPEGAATKTFEILPNGMIGLAVEVPASPGWGLYLGPGLRNLDPEAMENRYAGYSAVLYDGEDVENVRGAKLDEVTRHPGSTVVWAGLEDTYFITAVRPRAPLEAVVLQPVALEATPQGALELLPFHREAELDQRQQELPRDVALVLVPGAPALVADAFFGAKEYERLRALPWDLEKTVAWGMFGFLARPLLLGLNWIHDHMVPNYGWAIVLMTLLLKIILFPLTHRSYVSMQKMQKLQPRMQAIRQRYKGKLRDKKGRLDLEAQRKMNEEIQALFREEKASPTGGCLPLLLQMPIFFAFFRLLLTAVELRQEPWILWVKDLSTPDPWYLLPVLMGATQIWQQKLTPAAADPMQRRIMQLFPWMFTIFALGFPSGLVLYWTVNNLLTIVQTASYKKWKESREAEGGAQLKKKGK